MASNSGHFAPRLEMHDMFPTPREPFPEPSSPAADATTYYVPFNHVPKLPQIPRRRGGSRLSASTVHRWAGRGVAGVRLRHVRVGGTRCTTVEWLEEFFSRLAGNADTGSAVTIEPMAALERRARAAARDLEREGF